MCPVQRHSIDEADLLQAEASLAARGYCVLESVLDSFEVADLRNRLAALAADEVRRGVARIGSRGIQKIHNLLNKGPEFAQLVQHDVACALAERLLGSGYLLSNASARIVGPGPKAGNLHTDQYQVPEPWPRPLIATAIWMVDDFEQANGCTHVVVGSHKHARAPGRGTAVPDAKPIVGKAGSLLILDGRTWHFSGQNTTKAQSRHGIAVHYCASYLRPQDTLLLSVRADVMRNATPRLRVLLGLDIQRDNYFLALPTDPA